MTGATSAERRERVTGATLAERRERVIGNALLFGFDRLVLRELRGVWVRGELPTTGAVWMTNHHSWWDVFAAVAVLRREHPGKPGVIMNSDNLATMPFLRAAGALGTHEVRTAVTRVAAGDVMIVFPEGDLRPAGPLGPVRPGADWIARRAGVPVAVVATRVVLRGRQAPEAYLDIEPGTATAAAGHGRPSGRSDSELLASRLAVLDLELGTADPDVALPGFRRVVAGARSWEERIAGWSDAWTSTRARISHPASPSGLASR
ncbi:MAG: lysophospholipid acyltransferase family protein [bacterium]